MAITRLGAGAGAMTPGTAATFNSFDIVTSDANTIAIVGVCISVSNNSTSTTCSVTYGGVTMTQLNLTLGGSASNRNATGIYYLFNPGTGVKSVVVTPAGSSTKEGLITNSVAFSGADPAGVGAVQLQSNTTNAATSVTDGYDIYVCSNGVVLSAPSHTQEYLNGQTVGGAGDYGLIQSAAGTGSTITFTCTGSLSNTRSIVTALTPAAAIEARVVNKQLSVAVRRAGFY